MVWGKFEIDFICSLQIWWKYYVLMYENEKMRPVETIPEMELGR
jgi:hypothetical protein